MLKISLSLMPAVFKPPVLSQKNNGGKIMNLTECLSASLITLDQTIFETRTNIVNTFFDSPDDNIPTAAYVSNKKAIKKKYAAKIELLNCVPEQEDFFFICSSKLEKIFLKKDIWWLAIKTVWGKVQLHQEKKAVKALSNRDRLILLPKDIYGCGDRGLEISLAIMEDLFSSLMNFWWYNNPNVRQFLIKQCKNSESARFECARSVETNLVSLAAFSYQDQQRSADFLKRLKNLAFDKASF